MLLIDSVFCNGNKFRMKRSCSQGGDGTPVRRSARQAGQPPEDLPPPPPQALTTDQIMRMFEEKRNQDLMEFLKSMQAMVGQNNNHNGTHSKLSNFQRTKLPNFGQAMDPIEADDWLRTMEKKLGIARCEESDKVPFVTHYLEGPASIWWDNTKTT